MRSGQWTARERFRARSSARPSGRPITPTRGRSSPTPTIARANIEPVSHFYAGVVARPDVALRRRGRHVQNRLRRTVQPIPIVQRQRRMGRGTRFAARGLEPGPVPPGLRGMNVAHQNHFFNSAMTPPLSAESLRLDSSAELGRQDRSRYFSIGLPGITTPSAAGFLPSTSSSISADSAATSRAAGFALPLLRHARRHRKRVQHLRRARRYRRNALTRQQRQTVLH